MTRHCVRSFRRISRSKKKKKQHQLVHPFLNVVTSTGFCVDEQPSSDQGLSHGERIRMLRDELHWVVMGVAQLFHHCAPRSEVGLVARSIIRLLRSHKEVQYVVLSNIATMSIKQKGMFEQYLKSFYVRSNDPTHIKLLKLEILTNLATETNIATILRELQTYVTSSDKTFAAATIQDIGRCASNIAEVTDTCLNGLVLLMSNRDEGVVAESVVVIKKLLQMQSNEVKNSNAMELEGLKRGLAHLSSEKIVVTDIITDRHSQVRKWLRLEFPKIHHWFDVLHVAKSVVKKLEAVARKSKCGIVRRWAQSIKKHLYWCAASSNGNREEVLEKWTSIERHVTNIHEGHGNFYPQCQHGEIKRPWIDTGTKAHKELKEIVCSTRLKNDIAQLSFEEQTAYLESYHKIVCFFAAKHGHFFYPSMEARIQLAVLHFNENVNKDQAITKDGRPCWKISYPKFKKGGEVVKQVKVPVTYDYVTDLLDSVWNLRTDFPSYKEAQQNLVRPESSVPEFTTSRLTKRSKEEAVQSFKSRYSTR